jgi:hypothetical protein
MYIIKCMDKDTNTINLIFFGFSFFILAILTTLTMFIFPDYPDFFFTAFFIYTAITFYFTYKKFSNLNIDKKIFFECILLNAFACKF